VPQLPAAYKGIAEKAFREICKELRSKDRKVFAIGRTRDQRLDIQSIGYAPDEDYTVLVGMCRKLQRKKVVDLNADFYMYLDYAFLLDLNKKSAKQQKYVLLVIETKEGRWMASCEAKNFSRKKIKSISMFKWVSDECPQPGPFDGLIYSLKKPENQIAETDKLFGVGTLRKIYESQQLKNWVSLLEYEMSQGIKRESLNACALLFHNIYSELDAITGAGFIKKVGPFDPTAFRDIGELKKLADHHTSRGDAFESNYGIKCSPAHIILSDCFNDILIHVLRIEDEQVGDFYDAILENSVLEILQVVTDWKDSEDPQTYH
jgi:hypothetical protein